MNNWPTSPYVYIMVVVLSVITLVLSTAVIIDSTSRLQSKSCYERYAQSGITSRYTITTGCMLEVEPGVWIPAENWRFEP